MFFQYLVHNIDKIKEVFKIVKNLSNIIFLSRFFPMLIIINSLIMRVDDKAHCNYGIINAKLDCVVSCKGLYLPFSNFPLATINAIHAI